MLQALQKELQMQWSTIKQINKGWSNDTKYYIEAASGKKMVLRVSDIGQYTAKQKEYEIISKYAELGFEMSQPISFGTCNDQKNVYMLLTWVEGEDLELALPTLNQQEQYAIGRQAGTILRTIHSLPLPKDQLPTETKIARKKRQLQSYIDSCVRVPDDKPIIQYVQANIEKIWAKPPVYQHGDFHPGNLIFTPNRTIGVIDLNRWEIGDPYEEFYKLESFANDVSIPYCIGQIDGYFNDAVPEEFWSILAVYVAHAALYSIKWAEKFGQKEVANMIRIHNKSVKHYNSFTNVIPSWYTK